MINTYNEYQNINIKNLENSNIDDKDEKCNRTNYYLNSTNKNYRPCNDQYLMHFQHSITKLSGT